MLSNRLAKHFAAAAAASVVAGAANAAIVHWADANLVIPATIDGLYINVETRTSGSAGSAVSGWDLNPYAATSLTWFNATGTGMMRFPGVTTGSAGNLALGTVVGAAGSYGSGAVTVGAAAGNWQLNASNYFGFRFVGADGGTKYGWGRFVIGASISGADRTIAEIAYEDSGASINVGTVPAPGAIALLGLAGLAHRRRR
jgi:MYXO-CTERM domain-containing protein